MSLAYPVARSLEEAITPGVQTARTRREAAALGSGLAVQGLETSWLHLTDDEAAALLDARSAEGPAGHLQRYEDTSGHAVVAVSWWKLVVPGTPQRPGPTTPSGGAAPAPDHTDDLYFRRGRTTTKRAKPADPNQLSLFGDSSDA